MEPTLDEWRDLYAAADRFQQLAPWEWMSDKQIFGVEDPETGEIGWCGVLGAMREVFALTVYRGSRGLACLWDYFLLPEEPPAPEDVAPSLDYLMAEWDDRESLEEPDRTVLAAVGFRAPRPDRWPRFRSTRPGYAPWFLTAPETRFLTIALDQARDVCARVATDPNLLPPLVRDGEYLVRRRSAEGTAWRDSYERPAPVPEPEMPAGHIDERLLQKARVHPHGKRIFQVGHAYAGGRVMEPPRPFYSRAALVVDRASGYVLSVEVVPPGGLADSLVAAVLEAMIKARTRPAGLEVPDEESRRALLPLARELGIPVTRKASLPVLAEVIHAMRESMA